MEKRRARERERACEKVRRCMLYFMSESTVYVMSGKNCKALASR